MQGLFVAALLSPAICKTYQHNAPAIKIMFVAARSGVKTTGFSPAISVLAQVNQALTLQ